MCVVRLQSIKHSEVVGYVVLTNTTRADTTGSSVGLLVARAGTGAAELLGLALAGISNEQ